MGNAAPSRPPSELEMATCWRLSKRRRNCDARELTVLLRRLWPVLIERIGGPAIAPEGLASEWWPRIGFQGDDPRRDVRGGGALGLDHLLFLATRYPSVAVPMAAACAASRADSLPLAIVGINLTTKLCKMLSVDDGGAQADIYARCWPVSYTHLTLPTKA